jgi:hypothetical protein
MRKLDERALAINSVFTPALGLLGFVSTDRLALVGKRTRPQPTKRHWNSWLVLS